MPDSLDKSSGALSVLHSGEVNLNYSGNRHQKVCISLSVSIFCALSVSGHEISEPYFLSSFSYLPISNDYIRAPGFKVSCPVV